MKSEKSGLFGSLGGFGAAGIVGLCPVCIPAVGAFLSSIGLGFLVQESVLKPLLIVFLGVAWAGLLWSYLKRHKRMLPLALGIVAGIAIYVGRYVYLGSALNVIFMYGGIVGIIGVSLWNLQLSRASECSSCSSE